MPRNPRANVPEDRICEYEYPEGHPKEGQRCRAIKLKGSRFCRAHQVDPEKRQEMLDQLKEARELAIDANTKHGYYATTYKDCDSCTLKDVCNYYEAGKKVCDYTQKMESIDLSSLASIERAAQVLIEEQLRRMKKMEIFFNTNPESTEIFESSTICAKRVMGMLKDYATIKEKYETKSDSNPWENILENM